MTKVKQLFERRAARARYALRKRGKGRARLSVFRSANHIYAQIIDDRAGHTLCSASTLDKALKDQLSGVKPVTAAEAVGKLIGERAVAASISEVVFDRGGYKFHGRIKALADAARNAGLNF